MGKQEKIILKKRPYKKRIRFYVNQMLEKAKADVYKKRPELLLADLYGLLAVIDID
jgi:hypothetical protein